MWRSATGFVPEDLHLSAGSVQTHASELQLRQFARSGRIKAARGGVPAMAAVAVCEVVGKRQVDETLLFSQPAEHDEAIREAATGYFQHGERSAARIEAVGVQGGSLAADV